MKKKKKTIKENKPLKNIKKKLVISKDDILKDVAVEFRNYSMYFTVKVIYFVDHMLDLVFRR